MGQITCLSHKASMIILIIPLVTITYDKNHQKQNNIILKCSGGQFSPDDPFLSTDRGEVQDGVYFIKVKWLKDYEDDECDVEYDDDDVGNSWEVQGDVCFIKVRQLQLWLS